VYSQPDHQIRWHDAAIHHVNTANFKENTAMASHPLRALRMQLNTFYSGPQAWFFLAEARGYLRDEGLAIDFTEGDTAANTIPKMAANASAGGFDVGYGDINALIEHVAAGRPGAPLATAPLAIAPLAIFASYNASPYTIAVPLRTTNTATIYGPMQLAGKRLVAHPNDAALNLFPEFCAKTGLDPTSVTIEQSSAPHSELVPAMLAGQWDGLFGFVNTLLAASLDAGLAKPHDHLRFIEYHDHLPELYGMALMVNRTLAAREPQTVQALLRALNRGLVDTVADPQAAIDALVAYSDRIPGRPAMNIASNLRRLQGTLALEMGRAEGAVLGIGDLDDARFAAGIDLIVDTKNYPHRPKPAELFSRAFLPPLADRVRNLA
jgi:NitT/TauT family transport system substrate-binding protein